MNRVTLDGDPFFAFEVHIVEHLCLQLPLRKGIRSFEQPVGKRAFTVVDMGDDAEIADILHRYFFDAAKLSKFACFKNSLSDENSRPVRLPGQIQPHGFRDAFRTDRLLLRAVEHGHPVRMAAAGKSTVSHGLCPQYGDGVQPLC